MTSEPTNKIPIPLPKVDPPPPEADLDVWAQLREVILPKKGESEDGEDGQEEGR